jgi:putative hydrolase of the HAD superfamily
VNLVFDFGGVLFRWRPLALLKQALPHHATDDAAAHALAREIFTREWLDFDRGTIGPEALAEAIAARLGLGTDEIARVIDAVFGELTPIDHTVSLLPRLRERGHRLFFLSNMPLAYAEHLERSQHFITTRFDAGIYSAYVKLVKPEPAIYEEAARRFRIEPAETLFIDDVLPNVEGARRSGWQAFHFESPQQCEAELAARGLL